VAGCIDGGNLLISVRDNGCGFDPVHVPGVAAGHFGLQGIRERIESLEGTVEIRSGEGSGTKVTISIPLGKDGKENRR
jgi:signal transduction histidine kinase